MNDFQTLAKGIALGGCAIGAGLAVIAGILGILGIITNLGVYYPWLTVGIPAIPSLYFDWFGGCIQAFIFCTLTTLFIKQAAGD